MESTLGRVLLSWDIRLDVSLTLLVAGILYSLGWWRLRKRGRARVASNWHLAAYLGGLFVLGLALMSAIDVFQSFLFLTHMIQHLLLVMIAPVLLLLANPFPFFM
jgi:cytochrome c oxidase assembly factor CtaG